MFSLCSLRLCDLCVIIGKLAYPDRPGDQSLGHLFSEQDNEMVSIQRYAIYMSQQALQKSVRHFLLRASSLELALILLLTLSFISLSRLAPTSNAWWFDLLSCLLLLSSLAVVWRLGRTMLRDILFFREQVTPQSLHSMRHCRHWQDAKPVADVVNTSLACLAEQKYETTQQANPHGVLICAMRGKLNRVGFILVHLAMPMIIIGFVMDSNLLLNYHLWRGDVVPASIQQAIHDVPATSRLRTGTAGAFRGTAILSAGEASDEVRLSVTEGYVARQLPFTLALEEVRISHAEREAHDGFITQLVIRDRHLSEPVPGLLMSNKPLRYGGLIITQQRLFDGGSEMSLKVWPLFRAKTPPLKMKSIISTSRELQTQDGRFIFHFNDFSPRNIISRNTAEFYQKSYKNIGPSLRYRVTDIDDVERDYVVYMLPVLQDGRYYYLSKMKRVGENTFRYFHIPADSNGELTQFLQLHGALNDQQIVSRHIKDFVSSLPDAGRKNMAENIFGLVSLFNQGGYQAVENDVRNRLATVDLDKSLSASFKILRNLIYQIYKEGLPQEVSGASALIYQEQFFADTMVALDKLGQYGMPFYIQLVDFNYRPAVQLLVANRPGQMAWYLGLFMGLVGLALSLFSRYRRVWLLLQRDNNTTGIIFAGMSHRQEDLFTSEFSRMAQQLQHRLSL